MYSDGLAVDGGVGGAAVLMRGDVVVGEKKFHLGSDKDHMVYEGELVGMIFSGYGSAKGRGRRRNSGTGCRYQGNGSIQLQGWSLPHEHPV